MDIQRVLMMLGLAVTSYMLILAWNEDYYQNPAQPLLSLLIQLSNPRPQIFCLLFRMPTSRLHQVLSLS